MNIPEQKYMSDPAYHHFVDVIVALLDKAEFTPSEVREMTMYACIRYEQMQVRPLLNRIPVEAAMDIGEIMERHDKEFWENMRKYL